MNPWAIAQPYYLLRPSQIVRRLRFWYHSRSEHIPPYVP